MRVEAVAETVEAGNAVFHYAARIDGEEWRRGDEFWTRDRHGAPRRLTFQYVNGHGDVVAFNKSRHRQRDSRRSVPIGYITPETYRITLSRGDAWQGDAGDAELLQIAADLRDFGAVELAEALEAFAEDGGSVEDRLRLVSEANDLLDADEGES